MEGARHLPTLSMSSYVKAPQLFPILCFDGIVFPGAGDQHCQSLPERFPWLLLEYPEEVQTQSNGKVYFICNLLGVHSWIPD